MIGVSEQWQVVIVQDDPDVASVCRETADATGRLHVAGSFRRAEDALALIRRRRCDLVLVDLQLAGVGGMTFVRRLRLMGHPAEVIAVSATSSVPAVRAMAQWGAIDYVLKPFSVERLRQALGLFLHRATALRAPELDQAAVDRVCAAGREAHRSIPKGLSLAVAGRVAAVLEASAAPLSSGAVADAAGLARGTARRYLEHLAATGQAAVEASPSGLGRPPKLYVSNRRGYRYPELDASRSMVRR